MSSTYRSTAWLNGQMQWHIKLAKTDSGYQATTDSAPNISGTGNEEHQAVTNLKEQLRDAAIKGNL